MKFEKQLEQIKNMSKDECLQNHDFMLDYEQIHLEQCIGTGYKHQRNSQFSDVEIIQLGEAMHERIMEIF